MKRPLLTALILLWTTQAFAELTIPRVINFQSVLRDDAGNLLPDGTTSMEFRILDADGSQLYFETQTEVPVIRGAVNAMIGEGDLPGGGAPTGGIPLNALDPTTGEKLLQYRIGNNQPVDPVEFGLIPYAFWTEKSLSVVNDAIGTAQIKNGTIKLEDLEPNAISFGDVGGLIGISQIPPSIARLSDVTDHINNRTAAHHASAIAVDGPFERVTSNNVETALRELDHLLSSEITQRQSTRDIFTASLNTLETNLSSEAATRSSADAALQTSINGRVSKSGDVMSGNLSFNDADCTIPIGATDGIRRCLVDGVDVSNLDQRVIALGGRVTNLNQLVGVVNTNQVPTFMRPAAFGSSDPLTRSNIASITASAYVCGPSATTCPQVQVVFATPLPDANYIVIFPGAASFIKSADSFIARYSLGAAPSPSDFVVFHP